MTQTKHEAGASKWGTARGSRTAPLCPTFCRRQWITGGQFPPTSIEEDKGSYGWFWLWSSMTLFPREAPGQPVTQHLNRSKHVSMLTSGKGEEKGNTKPNVYVRKKSANLYTKQNGTAKDCTYSIIKNNELSNSWLLYFSKQQNPVIFFQTFRVHTFFLCYMCLQQRMFSNVPVCSEMSEKLEHEGSHFLA